jgi:voltage-gated sodium channel
MVTCSFSQILKKMSGEFLKPFQPSELLQKGMVHKLVVVNNDWNSRRWNARWLEIVLEKNSRVGHICYYMSEGGKLINRISTSEIADIRSLIENDQLKNASGNARPFRNASSSAILANTSDPAPQLGNCTSLWSLIVNNCADFDEIRFSFLISTKSIGSSLGKEYLFRANSAQEMLLWSDTINDLLVATNKTKISPSYASQVHIWIRQIFHSGPFETCVTTLIFANLATDVVSASTDSSADSILKSVYLTLYVLFAVELFCFNLVASNSLADFGRDPWNVFDVVIVTTSLLSVSLTDFPGVGLLRLTRVLRNFRLFKKVKALNALLKALQKSLPSVSKAFLVLLLSLSLCAILAVKFFKDQASDRFGCFSLSIFTLWTLLTFDNAADVNRLLISHQPSVLLKLAVALSVIVLQLFLGYVLMNVVMAILLDEFIDATKGFHKAEAAAALRTRVAAQRPQASLHPLVAALAQAESREEVERQVREVFDFIDEDDSGSVDFRELSHGLLHLPLPAPIVFTEPDFRSLVLHPGLHSAGRLSLAHFQALMEEQLLSYEQAELDDAVAEPDLLAKLSAAVSALNRVLPAARRIPLLERRAAALAERLRAIEAPGPPPPPPTAPACALRVGACCPEPPALARAWPPPQARATGSASELRAVLGLGPQQGQAGD